MVNILFVEDDKTIAEGVKYSLTREGFGMLLARRLDEARTLLKNQRFDLVLLDLGLPDGSGYTLCKKVRAAGDTPVIILSAKDEEVNIIMGLDIGADDYISQLTQVDQGMPLVISPLVILLTVLFTAATILFSAWVPAQRAASVSPSEKRPWD